ncbi:MAG: hypothetical protein DI535_03525 [Citrobacter freundii]|nr:MAG: hypothetical protein DI535_03525 [Citrobacter freundii]
MRILFLLILIFYAQVNYAQTWSEWFKQKKTQIRYLTQQIAALQLYIGYARKGYEIADKGLTMIGDIKNGEFNLYRDFFQSFKSVNPKLRNYARAEEVAQLQNKMLQVFHSSLEEMTGSGQFIPSEIQQARCIFLTLIEESNVAVEELVELITDENYDLDDNERLKRIASIHEKMKQLVTQVQSFGASNVLLSKQRSRDEIEIRQSKKVHGF